MMHRYTLRGRIGQRPQMMPGKLATAIAVYVLGGCLGWSCVGILIAVALR